MVSHRSVDYFLVTANGDSCAESDGLPGVCTEHYFQLFPQVRHLLPVGVGCPCHHMFWRTSLMMAVTNVNCPGLLKIEINLAHRY